MFISSLSLSELLSDKSESKNVIASTNFCFIELSEENIIENLITNLTNKTYDNDLYLIIVSWLNTIDLKNEIKTKEISFTNLLGNENKLIKRYYFLYSILNF